jgi:hypothetical protein
MLGIWKNGDFWGFDTVGLLDIWKKRQISGLPMENQSFSLKNGDFFGMDTLFGVLTRRRFGILTEFVKFRRFFREN